MKKTLKTFFGIMISCLLITNFAVTSFANTSEKNIHYYDDGSYIVETYTFENPTINLCATTKTGTKTAVYYSKDNIAQWSVAVKGTFSYGNGSATCTSASVTAKSNTTDWAISSKSSSKSGNTAKGTATAIQYLREHEIQRKTLSPTLSCSSTGTLY